MGKEMMCLKCGKKVQVEKVGGKEIYPHRPDLYYLYFYRCPHCHNYAGTKASVIPTPEIRLARKNIHNLIDPIWQSGLMRRSEIYKRLSRATGTKYHNGSLCSLKVADKAYTEATKIAVEVGKIRKI